MKILYLVSGIGPNAGWGTEYIQETIFKLSQKGITATFINPIYPHTHSDWKRWSIKIEKKYQVKIINFKLPKWLGENLLILFAVTPIFTTVKAISVLRKQKFDAIHEFSSTPIILFRALIFKILFKVKYVFTYSVYNNTILGKSFWFNLLNFADLYFIPSKKIIHKLHKKSNCIYVLPGIKTKQFKLKNNKKNKKFTITYFGSLTKEKGILDFVEAANILGEDIKKHIKINIYAVWKGSPKHNEIREIINKNELLNLHERYVDIPKILAKSDLVVLPQQTGHGATIPPISILETIAANRNIVTTETIGVKDVLSGKYIVPPNNPKELATKIKYFYKSNKNPNCNKNLIETFDINVAVDTYLKYYSE